jgi:hypothetical protein
MKSSNQLQREAEMHRQELSDSLDGLRTAATPSYVTTEVLNLAKDSSVSIAKALAEQARANPIPALLIGAGLVMMLTRTANAPGSGASRGPDLFDKAGSAVKSAANAGIEAVRGTADAVRETASSVQRTAADTSHYAGDVASDAARRAGNLASDTVHRAGDLASDATRRAADAASGVSETARATASQARDGVASTASGLMQQGQQTARQLADQAQQMSGSARNYVSTMAEEQPIVVAALGAAIGAAIGAALPMTAAERHYLGSTSARAKQAGRDTISKVADVVKSETVGDDFGAKVTEVTGKVVSAVTQELGGGKPDRQNQNTQSQNA